VPGCIRGCAQAVCVCVCARARVYWMTHPPRAPASHFGSGLPCYISDYTWTVDDTLSRQREHWSHALQDCQNTIQTPLAPDVLVAVLMMAKWVPLSREDHEEGIYYTPGLYIVVGLVNQPVHQSTDKVSSLHLNDITYRITWAAWKLLVEIICIRAATLHICLFIPYPTSSRNTIAIMPRSSEHICP
jgi:hypothetical protein